jgi:hypothetical protein
MKDGLIMFLYLFFLIGWIPILSIGKAASWIIDSVKDKNELNNGFQLIEIWKIHNLELEQVYERQEELNDQGWFTVINNESDNVNLYEIVVYGKL